MLATLGVVSLARVGAGGLLVHVMGPGKLLSVVAHLACRPARRARADELVELLWSGSDTTTGRHDLRQAIWRLRRRLGRGAIACDHGEVVFNARLTVDRDEFLAAVEQGALERALALYGGDFMGGWAPADAPAFEQWVSEEGYRLARVFKHVGTSLVRRSLARRRYGNAVRLATRLRDGDPHDQNAWALVFETLMAAGDSVRAAAEAEFFERMLAAHRRAPEPHARALLARIAEARKPGVIT